MTHRIPCFLLPVLIMTLLLTLCTPTTELATPSIELEPVSGGPGTTVTITGVGYPAGTAVRVRLGPPDVGTSTQIYGEAVTDDAGAFDLSMVMPANWPDGARIDQEILTVTVSNDDANVKAIAAFAFQPTVVAGCSAGGSGIWTPEDVRCYLDNTDPTQTQVIDEETLVLIADPQTSGDWAGAAIVFHTPSYSMLVLDRFGDVDPAASIFGSRAGLAALSEVAGDAGLMAGLKQQVQQVWRTTASNMPEIRLGAAWQEGPTTIFLISVAGLAATDDRFYCPSQTWTIGDNIIEVIADCVAHDAGTPVSQVLFEPQQIKEGGELPVQVALNGLPSNVVLVKEGAETQETAVYRAAMQHLNKRILIVRSETAPGLDDATERLGSTVDPALLKDYLVVNRPPTPCVSYFLIAAPILCIPARALCATIFQPLSHRQCANSFGVIIQDWAVLSR